MVQMWFYGSPSSKFAKNNKKNIMKKIDFYFYIFWCTPFFYLQLATNFYIKGKTTLLYLPKKDPFFT